MLFGLCGFLIIKPQTTLHYAVWCGALVHCYLRCSVIMLFCGQFWCDFCNLCSLYGLVNTSKSVHTNHCRELKRVSNKYRT